jgi:anti-sigma factor RsiW
MNHPTREEWMSYLYGETSGGERADMAAHLHVCPECAAKVNDWQAARKILDAWQVRPRTGVLGAKQPRFGLVRPAFQWAAAAAIMLILGFSAGRLTSRTVDVELVRTELRQEFAQMLREGLDDAVSATLFAAGAQTEEILANYASAVEVKRVADNQAIYAALSKLASQHDADYISLKKDLDTVAVNTDAGLRQTAQQLVALAGYEPAGSSSKLP